MNSDYIPRLRSELLRAGAAKQSRWRRVYAPREFRPLTAAAVVVVLLALAVGVTLSSGGSDETAVEPAAGTVRLTYGVEPAGAATAEQTAEVMRARLAAAGIGDARVSVASGGSLTITAPDGARADVTALTSPGRFAIYDWERNLLGPSATPVARAEAEARTAGRPAARVVRDVGNEADRWFALAGDPALTGADIASAAAAVDESSGEPIVTIELTARGQTAFSALTRTLAERGSASNADGVEAYQHLAIVLDDRVLSLPHINFDDAPHGIDGSRGAQIQGGLTPDTALQIAAILSGGPLPATISQQGG